MATKRITGYASGNTLYDIFRSEAGEVLNNTTLALEVWGNNDHTRVDYAFELTDQSGDMYTGIFPPDFPIAVSLYRSSYLQAGASPANGDTLIYGPERIEWTGEGVLIEGEEVSLTNFCNLALIKIGGAFKESTNRLSSYFEESEPAALCQLLWPQIRKEVLIRGSKMGVNWEEATKYIECGAELSGDNIPDMADWDYAFTLPSDCLRLIAQVDESDHTAEYDCEVMRGLLLTNDYSNDDEDSAYIKYIFDNDDITTYSPSLYAAMATKLAAELAAVIVDTKRRNELLTEYENYILNLAEERNQAQVYYDDKGDTSPADRRFNKYGKKS